MTSISSEQVFDQIGLDKTSEMTLCLIGNVETLKQMPQTNGIDTRGALLDFHDKWYSANIMALVVLGKGLFN